MENAIWVFIGGGLGSVARFWASGWVARHFGETFPWGTLCVNVTGSLLIGLFAAVTGPEGRWWLSPTVRQFVTLGFFGGYTTFSSFSLQTLNLALNGEGWAAGANVLLSLTGCLAGVAAGHALGGWLNHH